MLWRIMWLLLGFLALATAGPLAYAGERASGSPRVAPFAYLALFCFRRSPVPAGALRLRIVPGCLCTELCAPGEARLKPDGALRELVCAHTCPLAGAGECVHACELLRCVCAWPGGPRRGGCMSL